MKSPYQGRASWTCVSVHALPIVVLVLYLFYHWFAVADRYIVFLYYHDMGPIVPDTTPFSLVTASRYWMAGLVASGAIMVLYSSGTWLLGRLVLSYWPPPCWHLWLLCSVPLSLAIPAITMTMSQPTLPATLAAGVTLFCLAGLALAVLLGRLAARRPGLLIWLAIDGLGLAMIMLSAIGLERVNRWLAGGGTFYVWRMVMTIAAGIGLLLASALIQGWFRVAVPNTVDVFLAGLAVAYPLLTFFHHISGTDNYYYISDRDNFFARDGLLQLVIWLVGAAIAAAVTVLRYRQARWRAVEANPVPAQMCR